MPQTPPTKRTRTRETEETAAILEEARSRYASGQKIRGLPRPHDTPHPHAWYSVHRRPPHGTYLMLRWKDGETVRSRNLGRLD